MQDANGSRFALLLGPQDWGRCQLEREGLPALARLWASTNDNGMDSAAPPLAYDEAQACVSLAPRVGRFRAGSSDLSPDPARRRGAAADRNGNVYAVVDDGRRIDVRSAGSGTISVYWPVAAATVQPKPGDFGPTAEPVPPSPLNLQGLAVTTGHYLVAGIVPPAGEPGGLLVFDLLAGGPPLQLAWPAPWRLVPQDMAARADGGVAVLDREQGHVWLLDRRLGMASVQPVAPQGTSAFTSADGGVSAPAEGGPPPGAPPPRFDLARGGDPVALQVLEDGAIAVLDRVGRDGWALISVYEQGQPVAQASTKVASKVVAPEDSAAFVLRGFDMVLHALKRTVQNVERQQLIVVSHEGNQALAFALLRGPGTLSLDPDAVFLPLKRYAGFDLVSTSRVALDGDTGALYESQGRWLPLVAQRRPRYQPLGALHTPVFDGQDPGCTWHRLMLDGCIPPGCQLRVSTRCADEATLLPGLPWVDEPIPMLRREGSELPWLLDAPGARTDFAQGHGTWELLFQRAQGRWLQLRLGFEGNELATPRIVALRAWRPRFSYAERYLPAVYREDATSASFLERFLANFEGQFTALEDRLAAATALFDVRSAPAETLDWLAGWLGLVLDPSLDDARRRQLIRHALPLYQYRGTTAALRLAVQQVLSRSVADADFALPAPSQYQPRGVRIVEGFLARRLAPALLGETTFGDGPRQVQPEAHWSLAEGAEGLHRRWRDWLAQADQGASNEAALFGPLPPRAGPKAPTPSTDLRPYWQAFCEATLGAVPQLAQAFDAAWQNFGGKGPLGATLPADWPLGGGAGVEAAQQAWRNFLAGLGGPLQRWLRRWQGYLARRHLRIDTYNQRIGTHWPGFELVPPPVALPGNPVALADWALFETCAEAIAARAHAFSVLLPIAGPQAEAEALAREVDLARRVVLLAKPAHTRFDVRPYWAMFRLGQIRLGLDTLLGEGSRDPAFAPPLVLGTGHLGAARVAPRGDVPGDRLLLDC